VNHNNNSHNNHNHTTTNNKRHSPTIKEKYIQPHSMGPGTLFGEGGFLFGRQHSASIMASKEHDQPLECWVVDLPTFRNYVLLSDNMKSIFRQYASGVHKEKQLPQTKDNDGVDDATITTIDEYYMTLDDFMKSCEQEEVEQSDLITNPFPTSKLAQTDPWARQRVASTLHLLQPSRAKSYHSQISLKDFCWYYFLLARPDPEVDIAFLLMDQQQSGRVGLAQVASLVEPVFPQTDYESDFFRRYFGENGQESLRLSHFSQFFMDLHQELGRQVFVRASTPTNGYLKPDQFVNVLRTALGWRIPLGVADRIDSLYCRNPKQVGEAAARVSMLSGSLHQETTAATAERAKVYVSTEMEQSEKGYGDHIFSYPDFLAFQEVINNLPGICNLIDRAQEIKKGPLSPDDFKVANRVLGMGGRLSRRQVEIVFALFDLDKDGYISHQDTISVCGVDYARRLVAVEGREGRLTFAPPPEYRPPVPPTTEALNDQSTSGKIMKGLEYFGVTALASAVGTVLLFPVDLVKTRLMNQRLDMRGARMYKGFVDCLQKAFAREGFFGLYRGLTPQLVGVAPEKIIKLQINDLLRKALGSKDETTGKPIVNLPLETFAGGVSGACQLLVTNPMELIKIRMQMQGETIGILAERGWAHTKAQSPVDIVKSLGFPGIYRGASSCLLRDIFFGAMYFPMYAWLKEQLASKNEIPGFTTPFDLLAAGTVAGIPAAFFTTPLDVIKTRLQTLPRPGEEVYVGIKDCASMIYKREGISGFFLGSGARVCRIAPQFGITLLVYDSVRDLTGNSRVRTGTPPSPPTNAFVEPYDYHTAFPIRSFQPKTKEISDFMNTFGQQTSTGNKK
jgi:solute carrier family 25 aspartate/glutamate transporter 12/13